MVKTKKKEDKNKIDKNHKQKLSFILLIKSLFIFNIFRDNNISKKLLSLYSLGLLILISIISVMGNHIENYSLITDSLLILSVLIYFPIFFLCLYGFFYIFLNSFEDKRKPFFESFLVFLAILLPFIFIGNIFNYLGKLAFNYNYSTIGMILAGLLYLLAIYFNIVFIVNFKEYYNTSYFRIISSLIIIFAILTIVVVMPLYLQYLISALTSG